MNRKLDSTDAPELAQLRYADSADRWQSRHPRLARLGHRFRVLLTEATYVLPAVAALTVSGVVAHALGLAIGGVFVTVATPVVGFTRNQVTLTNKGRRLAATVSEVQALKESDAEAFTRPFATILRRQPVDAAYRAQAPVVHGVTGSELPLVKPLKIMPGTNMVDSTVPARDTGRGAPCRKHHLRWGVHQRDHRHRYRSGRCERPAYGEAPLPTFWQSLNSAEQQALLAVARRKVFERGAVLCRQSQAADFTFIIYTGWVEVRGAQQGGNHVIAIRGPGDIVGERASLQTRPRSATVVAMATVRVLIITTASFSLFLQHYPRVLEVLERQVYDRLTRDSQMSRQQDSGNSPQKSQSGSQASWHGQNCSIFMADIAAFGGHVRTDEDREIIRDAMYAILHDAFETSAVSWQECHCEDRGDGALIIVPPTTPTGSVVDPLLARLASALKRYNHKAADAIRIQLRVALHVGPVVSDAWGVSGEAIILAARILEARALKKELARTRSDLGIIVSTFVYDSVIKHGPGSVDPARYQNVKLRVKESSLSAWMCLSGAALPDATRPGNRAAEPAWDDGSLAG